jgi:hypothetical protein
MNQTPIDDFIKRHKELTDFLKEKEEITFMLNADDEFKKVLVLSIASYFEYTITDALEQLSDNLQLKPVANLIKNKVISRQYHTYFAWKENNTNQFLKLFGDGFKDSISKEIKENSNLKMGEKDFMELGRKRNELAHGNFVTASIPDWTIDDIIQKYRNALQFVNFITQKIIAIHNP